MSFVRSRSLDNGEILTLIDKARISPRLRANKNIHNYYDEPCQCLLNAIEPMSYIPPHRHMNSGRPEFLFAIRGVFVVLFFCERGTVIRNEVLTTNSIKGAKFCVEISPSIWHTVVAIVSGSVLLEVKSGPYEPQAAKEIADWCPGEGSEQSSSYLDGLRELALMEAGVGST